VAGQARLDELYDALMARFGPQHWWPAQSPFEVMVGAVLTQNTNWGNVERAIAAIRAADALDPHRLFALPIERLEELLRPAGYFRVKAKRLRNLLTWFLDRHAGDVEAARRRRGGESDRARAIALRDELLAVNGVGPETADSIVLYAFDLPTFVVDTYTRRVLQRHGIIGSESDYEGIRGLFETALPREVALYKEWHALLVMAGKHHCKPSPKCDGCPLDVFAHSGRGKRE